MNEQERRINQGLRALDEAHRMGRIGREDYRARRRALLNGFNDSDGVTARNALNPAATITTPRRGTHREAMPFPDMAGALFPDRRRWIARAWVIAVIGLALGLALVYALLQLGQG
jgi:hypothetical protein